MPSCPCYRQALDPKSSKRSKKKGESAMSRSKAERFRAMSAECERQAELASEEPEFRELQKRLAGAYAALAESEDWLDGRAGTETYLMPDIPAGERLRLLDRAS
jgi:hypothetical protein